MIRQIFAVLLALALSSSSLNAAPPETNSIAGFSNANAASQRQWQQKFHAIPEPAKIREYMQRLSARPHHVGSPYGKENAEWLMNTFRQWGLDAKIETFDVLFPTPQQRVLELVAPKHFTAKLQEPPVPEDPTSKQQEEQLPTYNAYSIDGDVTGPLVYVNYGLPRDYEELDRLGISVKGAIVIARYGASWRGIKPKVAAEHGAIGCIIYSDPRDDGYFEGDVFPAGPYRNPNGVQRGSVADMPTYPGDPLTPDVGATRDAKRLDLSEVKTLTKIPVLPISYSDAQPLLAQLGGPTAPESWRGALPITYHTGPGPARVHLVMKSNWDRKPVNNVIVTIPGSEFPDQWIVRGNHHDAWVNGAQDPVSGAAPEMEELRAYAELLKQGWRPKRTIIYAFWDGEEPGLLGSTEWAETHADELRQKAVAYINTDGNGRGFLSAGGSHSLETFVNDVARDLVDPEKNISVWQRLKLHRISSAKEEDDRKDIRERSQLRIHALGSGSDYTAFIDHLGIASLNFSYEGEDGEGVYHSIYDDFYWYTHFDDYDFIYGRALAQTVGTAVMRLASADVLPFDFRGSSDTIGRYIDELEKLAKKKREDALERNRQLDEGVFAAIADPRKKSVPPPRLAVAPYLNFAPLRNGIEALRASADRYQRLLDRTQQNGGATLTKAVAVNTKLIQTERAFLLAEGLPERPWFKHQIYAPGLYTGYGVKTIPAVREAIEQDKFDLAGSAIERVGKVLMNEAAAIDAAAAELERALQ
ncbi:MAG TPA: transferrin receptor-like dimerization domain-containing protein [Terriglobales bacterium]|nr:transferrin receptor-like dimerization domain-containing protein [Terriglobales bacterium]